METTIDLPLVAHPSMRSVDPATLFRVCSWADEGEIERAGEKAARLLQEGIYDFQLVTLWLAYRFARDGVVELVEILRAATDQLVQDLEGAAPADEATEARELDRSLSWLVSNVAQRLHFHSKMRDGTWTRWLGAMTPELLDEIGAQIDRDIERLEEQLEPIAGPTSLGELRKLERRVRGAFGAIVEQASQAASGDAGAGAAEAPWRDDAQEATRERARETASDSNGADDGTHVTGDAVASAPSRRGSMDPDPAGAALPDGVGSERMRALRHKLAAFEELAECGALREAAIVARDVEQELGQFDPLLYLPEVFEGYLSTLLRYGAELEEHMVEGHGLEERALERLYRADPKTFLRRVREEQSG